MKLFLISIILFPLTGFAQPYETNPDFNRANHWFFGDSVWLDFNSNPPQNRNGSQLSTIEPSTSYSDIDGNLIVYSDGNFIWNKNHQIIENGSGILGHFSSRQGAVFIPQPNNDSILLLFTTDAYCGNNGLRYSEIILHKNPDSIKVNAKNIFIANGLTESIKVTKHSNNIDYWIVVHSATGNTFYSYLLTKNGLVTCPAITQIGYNFDGHSINCQTLGDFNLQGNKFVYRVLRDFKVMTFDFNTKTGKLSNYKQYDDIPVATGLTFSTNNSYIYVIERDRGIRRINLINNSYDTISQINPFEYLIIQTALTPKGNIYCNVLDSNHVAVISDINSVTPSFNLKLIPVGNKRLTNGLPNFVKSYFHTPSINFTTKLNCALNTIQFNGQDTFNAVTHDWFIIKQGGTPITASVKAPLIEFTDTGIYSVRYIASNGSRSDTTIKEVDILPKINKNFLGNDTGWCNTVGTPITLQAPSEIHCYEWNTGETTSQIVADTVGVYIAKITTPNFCVIYDTLIVSIDTTEAIEVEDDFLGIDKYWCENIDTVVTLSAPIGFASYKWNNGLADSEIEVSKEGKYWVRISKRNQCENDGNLYAHDTLEITMLNAPSKPILSRINDSLFVNISDDYTFKWYFNNAFIQDSSSYLIARDTGEYFLEIKNTNECKNYSDTIRVASLGIAGILAHDLKIHPNPTSGMVVIEVLNYTFTFTILDIAGRVISKGQLNAGSNEIDLSNLPNGTYLITIHDNIQTATYKIIKQSE